MPGGLFSALKSNAKRALRGSWGKAIGILFISLTVSILFYILQMILDTFYGSPLVDLPDHTSWYQFMEAMVPYLVFTGLLALLSWLLSPLTLGIQGWYARLVYERETPVGSIFSFFERGRLYLRALWYSVNLGVRTALWSILFFLLPSAAMGCLIGLRDKSSLFILLVFLTSVLFIVMAVLYVMVLFRYFLAPYLMTIDDSLTANQAIKKSVAYTKGFRVDIFLFHLSFIGWFLLTCLLFPLGLYTVPYFNTSAAMLARYIVEYNQRREEIPQPIDMPNLSDTEDLG